ncbi:MAG: hypothetical protein EON60_13510 [Alphaproteobacteria bacterium]|nr:MAG: hypothetical protein EON60_13510 [Alphaproteobacteria bacterium]
MLDLAYPINFQQLSSYDADNLLRLIRTHCSSGKNMHPEALKTVVVKLTYFSRDLSIKQMERDEAAEMATSLANAAIKSYGRQSAFCAEMMADVQAIVMRGAA